MRIGLFASVLLALQLQPGADWLLVFVTCLIGAIGGIALSEKLDAMASKGGEDDHA